MSAATVIRFPARQPGNRRAVACAGVERGGVPEMRRDQAGEGGLDELSELLVAVRDRQDREAFSALFRHFAPRVKSYLMRFGDDRGKVEEVLQETFAAVWTKARLYDPSRAAASTWIFTIARNRRIDAFRRDRRPEFDPNDPAFVPEPEPEGADRVTARERSEYLKQAMEELSDEQREVLRLSFFEEHSHDAIATRLGLPVGTVKSRIRLAYGHLRARLESKAGGLL